MRAILVLSSLISTSLFAIVSIAPVDIGEKPGYSGNVSGSASSKSGNTQKDEYSLGMRLQYDQGEEYVTWGTLSYDYGKSNGTKNEDKIYLHVRYIHALAGNNLTGELFLQSEQDKFKQIQERSLAGTGLRCRLFNSDEWGKGYVGIGGFFEKIEYIHPELNPNENNTRLNSYIAYTKRFSTQSRFSYRGYYQPKFSDDADYVALHSAELILPITGNLNLSLIAKYVYDSMPIPGVEKKDTALKTSLVWEF